MYKILRSVFFLFDPEWVHYFSMNSLKLVCKIPLIKNLVSKKFTPRVEGNIQYSTVPAGRQVFNIQFPNKVGLGAGFDKDAKYLNELQALGFGFIEIGTVTPLPQSGNEKPRLFRLPKDKALINRMGFNNDGVEIVVGRLKKWRQKSGVGSQKSGVGSQESGVGSQESGVRNSRTSDYRLPTTDYRLIIGGNIGKNKLTPNEHAWKDYETCFLALHEWVDYFVVNVSSPNTPGLRELQEKESLKRILTNLQIQSRLLRDKIQKPILLKIAPDLTPGQVDDVISLALEIKLDGLVVCNTTISRDGLQTAARKLQAFGAGGLSGLPLKQRSTELVKYIHMQTKGSIPIIASGGIFTGEDAKEKLDAGASLVQVWTGFIYEGPGIVKRICKHLAVNSPQSVVNSQ